LEDLKAREQFLTNISHEIRTPLHGIMSLVDILSETKLDTEQAEFLKTIQGASQNLFSLLNDVLDFYKIGIGKMTLENTTFNIVNLINSIISLYIPKANSKKIEMLANFDPKIPMLLQGDSNRLRQVLSNLTDNALKYTNEGKIEVKTEFIEQISDVVTLRIHIKDTGIGIEKSKKEIIFNKFSQANNSDSRIYGGTGIGLHLVKELLILMGGRISVESIIDKGSAFTVELSFTIPKTEKKKTKGIQRNFLLKKRIFLSPTIQRLIHNSATL
jgi:signal transduction histidine kinase